MTLTPGKATEERRRRSRSNERHEKASRTDKRRRDSSPRTENTKNAGDAKKSDSRSAKESGNAPKFQGPEFGMIARKEIEKIQIEIRRNLPDKSSKRSPIRRTIADPENFVVPRREGWFKKNAQGTLTKGIAQYGWPPSFSYFCLIRRDYSVRTESLGSIGMAIT